MSKYTIVVDTTPSIHSWLSAQIGIITGLFGTFGYISANKEKIDNESAFHCYLVPAVFISTTVASTGFFGSLLKGSKLISDKIIKYVYPEQI